jgi:hypothetical protein
MVARFRVRLHACVLMDNYYHLIVELTEANLSRAMQWLNVRYSVWFNRRDGRSGQVILGGEKFLQEMRAQVRGNPGEQRGAGRLVLAPQPGGSDCGAGDNEGREVDRVSGPVRRQRTGLGFVCGKTGVRNEAWGTGGRARDAGLRRGISGNPPL